MTKSILIDSNFLIAIYNLTDKYHLRAVDFVAQNTTSSFFVPEVALVEVMYTIEQYSGHHIAQEFLQDIMINQLPIVHLENEDYQNIYDIREKYPQFDFVDACIMALSERLGIRSICTFDRRDFAQYRPSKWEYLELLPE